MNDTDRLNFVVAMGLEPYGREAQALEFAVIKLKSQEMTSHDPEEARQVFRAVIDAAVDGLTTGEFVPNDPLGDMVIADVDFPDPGDRHEASLA